MKQTTVLSLLCLAAFLAASTPPLRAQAVADSADATDAADVMGDPVKLDAFSVNGDKVGPATPTPVATKLPLSVRQTPQSISIIGRDRLDAELLTSVNDVMKNVTGVYATFFDTQRPAYYARGFKIEEFQVDGMPSFSSSTNMEFDTGLYERVEIIRGAHGLLTGAGIPSAVINLQRKRPGKTFAAALNATAGSWDLYRAEADVTVPLTKDGRVRSRFVAVTQTADSFRDRYSEEKGAWLASAEADLTATTTLGAGYQFQDNDPTNPIWGTTPRFASDGSLAHLPRSTSFSTNWTEWQRDSATAFVTLDQKLGEKWAFRAAYNRTEGSTSSLRVYASGFPNLTTGAGLFLLAGVGITEDTRDTLDLYLSGKFSLLGREHDLVIGWNQNNLESYAPTIASITSGAYYYRYDIPDYRTFNGEAPCPTIVLTGASRVTTTDQNGFYATTRLRPFDRASVILGARLSSWETYADNYSTAGAYTSRTGAYKVTDEVTPYVGVVYDLNDTWSAYASYTDIFRPQNYKDKNFELLSPVLGTNLEAGLKAEFFAKRFQVSFGVFQTEQDNYGVVDASVPLNSLPDGSTAYLGVNGTKSEGFELELTGFIRPGWTTSLGYSNINTHRHALDLTYANIPEHLLRFHTNYQFTGALKKLSAGLGVNWQSEQVGYGVTYINNTTTTVEQSAFALVNLNASYQLTENLTLTAAVRNALDKNYWATLDYANYGEPRAISASLRWRF
jgi:outer-membrane receptor for ferric coprogen and ferric-rhodotorulic acid